MEAPQGPEQARGGILGPSSSFTPGDLPGGVWHGPAAAGLVLSVPIPHPEEHTGLQQLSLFYFKSCTRLITNP